MSTTFDAIYDALLKSIARYEARYAKTLAICWADDVQRQYDCGKGISFRVYFEDLIYS